MYPTLVNQERGFSSIVSKHFDIERFDIVVVKAHGSSDEYLFYFTLKQAENFVKSGAVDKMKEEFEKR